LIAAGMNAYQHGQDALYHMFNENGCWPDGHELVRVLRELETACDGEKDPEAGIVHAYDVLIACELNGEATRFRKMFYTDVGVCTRCGIKKRPEGGHMCGSCGEDV
jgi:hypothetical protein